MQTSEKFGDLMEALSKAQGEYPVIPKTKVGKITGESKKTGKYFEYEYKYADIADILLVIQPILSKHGLSFLQPTIIVNGAMYVRSMLFFKDQFIWSDYPVCDIENNHRNMGGSLTYARRYGGGSLLCIAPDEDLDAAGAADSVSRRAPTPPRQEAEAHLSDEEFTRFRLTIEGKLKDINDAEKLNEISNWTFKQLREFKATSEQHVWMEGVFQQKTAEIGTTERPKRKAPPPPRSAEPYSAPGSYEDMRKTFLKLSDGLSDYDEVVHVYETTIGKNFSLLFPPDQEDAQALLRSYEAKLAP
jgi:hypothetical protein